MKIVKLKSIPRNPKEMCQVAVETGCGQHMADIWWKARTLERENVGESVLSRSRGKGGSVLRRAVLPRKRGGGPSLASGPVVDVACKDDDRGPAWLGPWTSGL